MNYEEHENIKKNDFRLHAITTTVGEQKGPAGIVHPDGSPVMLIAFSKFEPGVELTLGIPNMPALFLHLSGQLHKESARVLRQSGALSTWTGDKSRLYVERKNEKRFYDALEKRAASVVFAYTALEAFANQTLPDDFVYVNVRDDHRFTEQYDKDQIEKWVSLSTKLDKILPSVTTKASPKGGEIWEDFKQLESLRNRIIHLKSKDVKSSNIEKDSIWNQLLVKDFPDYSLKALGVIGYFIDEARPPRWFAKYPTARND